MKNTVNIVVVDDHSLTLAGICNIVEKINKVVIIGTAHSGKNALEILKENPIDILITDIEMDDIGGIELSTIVRKTYPHIKIIAITMHNEPWITSKLINLNIDAIIMKSKTDLSELESAINKVTKGGNYYSEEIINSFFRTKEPKTYTPNLTTREREVLILVCSENTIKEIATKLNITSSTVESHRKNLFVKLKVKSQSGLVREAIRHGIYKFD